MVDYARPDLSSVSVPQTSSHVNSDLSLARFLPVTPQDLDQYLTLNKAAWVDPFDFELNAIVDQITSYAVIEYDGTPFPALAMTIYGTTSPWWLILMFNGITHPDKVQRGSEIKIPSLDFVAKRKREKANRKGEPIKF